ncbi:MAG: hypothetical protein ABSF90_21585 [Syntrophobacteraceae bacterium]|jgi:dipeptidyl aminopeptidase/acylaminoacyl peptidase
MNSAIRLSILGAVSIMLLVYGACSQAGARTGVVWQWHEGDTELYHAQFSPDGREIAAVRKRHIPDGFEAGLLPDDQKRERFNRIDLDERYADPEVIIVEVDSDRIARIDWGWSPAFSPDGSRIAYAHQVKPISRFRVLAKTLEGNEIRIYDRNLKTAKTVASPEEGYLADPMFSPDGKYLVYSIGGPVNGAYGGNIGLARMSIDSGKKQVLCPPFRTDRFENDRIDQSGYLSDQLFALIRKTVNESEYDCELVAVGAKSKVAYSWGRISYVSPTRPAFSQGAGGEILIKDGAWHTISNNTPLYTPSAGEKAPGVPSPNGLLLAISNESGISVRELGSGAKVRDWKLAGPLQSIVWSSDSRRLAVIVSHYRDKEGDLFEFDELIVLEP